MKEISGESANKYRIRMEDKVRYRIKYKKAWVRSSYSYVSRFKVWWVKNPNTTYPVDLVSMGDLVTNWSSKSNSSRNDVPSFGVIFNLTGGLESKINRRM